MKKILKMIAVFGIAFGFNQVSSANPDSTHTMKVESWSELEAFLADAKAIAGKEQQLKQLQNMVGKRVQSRQTNKYAAIGLLSLALPATIGGIYLITRNPLLSGRQTTSSDALTGGITLGTGLGLTLVSDYFQPYGFWDSPKKIVDQYNEIRAEGEMALYFEPISWQQRFFYTNKKWVN